ncbi:hypothetical protein PIIN_01769, partial [Serendipita indica DSM 11827]
MNTLGSLPFAQHPKSKTRQVIYETAAVGLDVVANISEGTDILAPLKAACRATRSILEAAQAVENSQEGWINLTQRFKEYIYALEEQITLFEAYPPEDRVVNEAFNRSLIRYVEFLETMHDKVVDLNAKRRQSKLGFLRAFPRSRIDAEEIVKLNRDIEDRHRQFMVRALLVQSTSSPGAQEALGLFTSLRIQGIERNIKVTKADMEVTKSNVETILTDVDASAILQLPVVAFVASSVHSTCLKGTREAVLETIWRWAGDDASEKPIFWLCDIAGSGKSTVAMSAVETWRKEGVLGGRFFFSIASNEGSTTEKFCTTIARDLAHYIPALAPHIARAVKRNPSLMRSSLDEQFQLLITDTIRHRHERVIFVIDGLDECKSGSNRRELLQLLLKAAQGSKNLKIFMTSRPDPVIEAALGSVVIQSKLEDRLHNVSHHDNVEDVAFYIHKALDGVLPDDKRQRLIDKANGLFIWASTACRMLNSETTLDSPESIYDLLISVDQRGDIDDIYNLVFERIDPNSYPIMRSMLALLLVAFEPLSIDDLDDAFKHIGVKWNTKALIRNLGSVLSVNPTTNLIQFRHPTLVEYLRRCSQTPVVDQNKTLFLDVSNAHGQASLWCLKCLTSRTDGLKFNICQLESSFYLNREIPDLEARVSKFIPRKLRYASSHWLFHFAETDDNRRSTLKKELQHIIQLPNILYWMEVLSFIGGVPRAIAGFRAVTNKTGLEEAIRSYMNEIRQFIISFSVPIQDSAPHIYISALPFTPTTSKFHTNGLKMFNNVIAVKQGLEKTYAGLPGILRGHKGSVLALVFSKDGSKLVSSSSEKEIRIWDAYTGQPLGKPIRGHEDSVWAVAFSPDGSQIISVSRDKTIRLWDAGTGQPLGEPFPIPEVWIALAFSPDGSRIVSSSSKKTIRLWGTDNGQPLGESFRGHEGWATALAFSPD